MKKVIATKMDGKVLWNILEENGLYEYEIYVEKNGSFKELKRENGFSDISEAERQIKEYLKSYAKEAK